MRRASQAPVVRVGRRLRLPFLPAVAFGPRISDPTSFFSQHHREQQPFNDTRRFFGSFHGKGNRGGDSWYRHSLNTVVNDLRAELDGNRNVGTQQQNREDPIQAIQRAVQENTNVNQSFSLLDQLVIKKDKETKSQLDYSQLNTSLLNLLVSNWKRCWRNSSTASSAQKTTTLPSPWQLLEKINHYQDFFPQFLPNTETFNIILSIASENYDGEDPHQIGLFVQSVVDQMRHGFLEEGVQHVRPDSASYNILVQTWARAGNLQEVLRILQNNKSEIQLKKSTMEAVSQASMAQQEVILKLKKELQLPSPPADTTDTTSSAAPSSYSTPRVELEFQRTEQVIDSKERTKMTFELLDKLILSKEDTHHVPTDAICSMLRGWKKFKMQKETSLTAMDIVQRVLQYHDQPNEFQLDTRTYNALILALSHDRDRSRAVRCCQGLLKQMEQESNDGATSPNTETYNRLIQLYANAGNIQDALDLIISAKDKNKNEQAVIQISPGSFNTILSSCLKLEDTTNPHVFGEFGGETFNLIVELYEAGMLTSKADVPITRAKLYARIIQCWEKSGHPDATQKIPEILKFLEQTDEGYYKRVLSFRGSRTNSD